MPNTSLMDVVVPAMMIAFSIVKECSPCITTHDNRHDDDDDDDGGEDDHVFFGG
jgi:hypothetical protein